MKLNNREYAYVFCDKGNVIVEIEDSNGSSLRTTLVTPEAALKLGYEIIGRALDVQREARQESEAKAA